MAKGPSWKELLAEVVGAMPRQFTLREVLGKEDYFRSYFPQNRFVDAKIRQSLQILRDQGVLRFLGNGRYERLDVQPVFSPLIDLSVAAALVSRSQVARVALETWASLNLFCLNCSRDALDKLPDNTPVSDFECRNCESRYQVKSKNGRFGERISGAAYAPVLKAARDGSMPEHVLLEFDTRFSTVVFADAIPGRFITEERIVPRRKLSSTARRAGWQGCNIVLSNLPRVRLVEPAGLQRTGVRDRWREIYSAISEDR